MEQNSLLPVINTEILKNLPDTLVENSALADRAVATVKTQLATLMAGDITALSLESGESDDAHLADLQGRLKEAYTIMNNGRSPFTKLFDEIKSKFTTEEKKVVAIGEEVKARRDNWQKEKARRNEIARKEAEAKQQASEALIEAKAYFAKHIVDRFSTCAVQTIQRMHSKFYSLTIGELDAYAAGLKGWSGALDNDTWNTFLAGMINPKPQLLTGEQMQALLNEVVNEQKPKLSAEWKDRMVAERDGLIELVPSRKMELERIAGDAAAAKEAEARIAAEKAQREADALKEAKDREEALATQAEVEKVNSAFEMAAEGAPVVGIAKGTVVKKKYQPKTHAAWLSIVQSWVTNDMAKMTVEELSKKLSFMKTACEGRLNNGEELKANGLEVEEDYSTRSSRKREVA
jgi:hemerythrin